jgi:hypothetical protein
MTGPYDGVPPSYWLLDTTHGGAAGFKTETSPGPAVPPLASLRQMLPAEHLWPIDEYWSYHAGGGPFRNLQRFATRVLLRDATAAVETAETVDGLWMTHAFIEWIELTYGYTSTTPAFIEAVRGVRI